MDSVELASSEEVSEKTEPLSDPGDPEGDYYSIWKTHAEGTHLVSDDVGLVSLDALRVEDHHHEQGIRILVRPTKYSTDPPHFGSNSDNRQWLDFHAETASTSKEKPVSPLKVLAISQNSDDVKFSVRISGITQNDHSIPHLRSIPPLWADFYYDPATNNIILSNKSEVPILLEAKIPSPPAIINPGAAEKLGPGTWRLSIDNSAALDFRILGKWQPDKLPDPVLATQLLGTPTDRPKIKAPNTNDFNPLLDIENGETFMVPGVGANQIVLPNQVLTKNENISRTSLSAVYSARHSDFSSLIAVKVLQTRAAGKGESSMEDERNIIRQADTWLREARNQKSLDHKCIVRYYGHDARYLSIYMELVAAQDLTARPRWRSVATDEFQGDVNDARRIARDISSALSYIHRQGLVHNDIKPGNILYSPDRGGVLCDFGLSTTTSQPPSTGGTPYYVPPEFIETKSRGPAGDVWALGITMLYVLRKIGLPDGLARRGNPRPLYWLISGIHNSSRPHTRFGNGAPGLEQMRQWLLEVATSRDRLDSDNLVERMTMEMLDIRPSRRVTAERLSKELAAFDDLNHHGNSDAKNKNRLNIDEHADYLDLDTQFTPTAPPTMITANFVCPFRYRARIKGLTYPENDLCQEGKLFPDMSKLINHIECVHSPEYKCWDCDQWFPQVPIAKLQDLKDSHNLTCSKRGRNRLPNIEISPEQWEEFKIRFQNRRVEREFKNDHFETQFASMWNKVYDILFAKDMPHATLFAGAVPPTDSGYASTFAARSGLDSLKKNSIQAMAQSREELVSNDDNDTATQYSNTSSVSFSKQHNLIWELANDLFTKINLPGVDQCTQASVSTILPGLLKAFALKVGYNAPSQMHRDIMAFVHKNRHEIATTFTEIGFGQDEEGTQQSRDDADAMDLQDRMRLWYEKVSDDVLLPENELRGLDLGGKSADQLPTDDFEVDEIPEEEEVAEKWSLAYRELLSSNEAYNWLLGRLQREFHLVTTEPNNIRAIRDKIASLLPQDRKISRKKSPRSSKVIFCVQWDIFEFFETQKYSKPPEEAFEGIITLTGSLEDAQAATCGQYIRQTWPSTGETMIQLMRGVLQSETHTYEIVLPDKSWFKAEIRGLTSTVEVHGTTASVIEVGEQLAWLGAALRASPKPEGLLYCTPVISDLPRESISSQKLSSKPQSIDLVCQIHFTTKNIPQSLQNVNGRCWHGIFRNTVVVRGYPIPRKAEYCTGLEIPLNIMAGLVRTRRVDQFKERSYIKGFSTMLLLTRRSENNLYWHLLYNRDGSRISYLDDHEYDVDESQHIGRLDIEGLRHVVGWCSEAKFYAGSSEAHHPVNHSSLPRAHAGCALAGIKVSPGQMIMDGPEFSIGARDRPVHLSLKGNIRRLKWISTKFFLLWDTRDERGWLINGTSALLHIVRASLSHASEDPFRSAFVFNSKDIQEARIPFKASSAVEVLLNNHNRNLRLYEDDDENGGYVLLKSQIDHFYNLLEKLIDHQTDITGDDGLKLSDKPRRNLEGWDFEDLITDCDPLRPRVATIEAAGKGWVDFIRAINAVVLVGSGFGDIIRPSGRDICEYWADLPKNQYYIAGCLSDMERLRKEAGGYGDHVWLTSNLICHTPSTVFMSCRCRGELTQEHNEPVQAFLPSEMSELLQPRTHPMELKGSGAVIFGHSSHCSWVWGDTGPPQQGELMDVEIASNSAAKDSNSVKDSGIGLSPSSGWSGTDRPFLSLGRSTSEFFSQTTRENSALVTESGAFSRDQYTVGIMCALPKELMAVRVLFDTRHHGLRMGLGESNQYALGEMAGHRVVATCLPAGEYGTNSAASVASNMKRSFPFIRFCLLVGIAGGAPSQKNDIRLGDVVVGQPTGTNPGVLQYDLGKSGQGNSFQLTGVLQRPPRVLTNAINALQSDPELRRDPLGVHLAKITAYLPDYGHPGAGLDILLPSPCAKCVSQEVPYGSCPHVPQRVPRATSDPVIHYGIVASGNRVVKDAAFRDRLTHEYDVLCFEMEAAGVINTIDCLVIRGICDYCDAKKNDSWQEYAAATAAAYAKLLLGVVATVEEENVGNAWASGDEPAIKKRKRMPL